jgi:hypothetical protein
MRPACLGLGVVLVVLVSLIGRVPRLWLPPGDGGPAKLAAERAMMGIEAITSGVVAIRPADVGKGLVELVVGTPAALVREYPASTWAVLLPALIVLSIGGGTIARLAALDFVRHPTMTWPGALGFGIRRGAGFASAMLAPSILGALLIGSLALAGFLLWSVPLLQVVAAVAFPLMLVVGLITVILAVGQVLGVAMFVPALACEGTDWIDAVQRVYAYIIARPVRVLMCGLIVLAQLIVIISVAQWLADVTVSTTLQATAAIAPAPYEWLNDPTRSGPPGNASGSLKATLSILAFWSKLPGLIVAGLGISLFFSAGTICYLLLRQACDGQDPRELWRPGGIPGITRLEDDGDRGEDEL